MTSKVTSTPIPTRTLQGEEPLEHYYYHRVEACLHIWRNAVVDTRKFPDRGTSYTMLRE